VADLAPGGKKPQERYRWLGVVLYQMVTDQLPFKGEYESKNRGRSLEGSCQEEIGIGQAKMTFFIIG